MTHPPVIRYYDRYTGRLESERVHAAAFLNWAYNSRTGRWAVEALLKRRVFSRAYGWYHRQRISRGKIRPFVEAMHVDTAEMKEPLEAYGTFHEFFIREIDLARRPVSEEGQVCVAPADGKVLAYSRIVAASTFRVKCSDFNLRSFLRDPPLAADPVALIPWLMQKGDWIVIAALAVISQMISFGNEWLHRKIPSARTHHISMILAATGVLLVEFLQYRGLMPAWSPD